MNHTTNPQDGRERLAGLLAVHVDHIAAAIRVHTVTALPEDKPGLERAAGLLALHKGNLFAEERSVGAEVLLEAMLSALPAVSPSAVVSADRATLLRAAEALQGEAKRLTGEFNDSDILHEDGPAASVATWKRAAEFLRRLAAETPPAKMQGAAEIRAAALREAADRYATLTDQNEAYDRAEHGEIDETARAQYETVRDVVIGLRRMADETQAADGPSRVAAEEQPAETHSCRNCEGIDPDTCLFNPDRPKQPPMDPVHILGIGADDAERPAVGEQPAETQARPPHHRWYTETRDGLADEWAPGMRFTNRTEALARYRTIGERHPLWKDGTHVERRFVRETTSYTVEDPQPAVGEQPDTQTREAGPRIPCNWARTRTEHLPHGWEPQPGMDPVDCPGHSFAEDPAP